MSRDREPFDDLLDELAAAPPVDAPGLERYRLGKLLGDGGAGQVYQAFDLKLKREVALKFLSSRDPEVLGRLLREAQAQARVEHPSICKVYEIVETGGRPFISMQLIIGRTLAEAAGTLALRDRVAVMAKVAAAIDAAHQLGIVHRDLKPANIMIESGEGGPKPFVLDFGLARDVSTTMTQPIAGTPSFMSPEQARGDARQIGPATDVYGLGATLCAVLTGAPPFAGQSPMEVLAKVQADEPPQLRARDAGLPRELEIIVATCLRKEPERRYPSAAALARDLEAWLRGEPIAARPEGFFARALRRARRHRALVAVSAAALLVALVLGAVALEARRSAAQRLALARELIDDTNQMDSILRIASLLPLHDTAPERARIREHLKSIGDKMQRSGALMRGPGLAALGRGHLALHEYPAALANLDAAYQAGERDPDLEYALGKTLGHLYQSRLAELRPSDREAHQAELAREFRDPALAHLQRAAGTRLDTPEYVEGLIAFYDERYQEAAVKARAAFARVSWLYEALVLEGDAYVMLGRERRKSGDPDAAQAFVERAAAPIGRALAIAHSDDLVYLSECRRLNAASYRAQETGKLTRPMALAAIAPCDQALLVNPENGDAFETKADTLNNLVEAEAQERADCDRDAEQAIAAAERAAELGPGWSTLLRVGEGYAAQLTQCLSRRVGADPQAAGRKGIAALERSIAFRPTARAWTQIGQIQASLANEERWHGRDPRVRFAKAIEAQERALELAKEVVVGDTDTALFNLGGLLVNSATFDFDNGVDPNPKLDRAAAAFRRADAIHPGLADGWSALGDVEATRALYLYQTGGDPRPRVADALGDYQRALAINPRFVYGTVGRASALAVQAEYSIDRGISPQAELAAAARDLAQALAVSPDEYDAFVQRCALETLAARFAQKQGESPASHLDAADAACRRAVGANPSGSEGWVATAEANRRRAELGASPAERRRAIGLAARALDRALELNRGQADAHALAGELAVLELRLAPAAERKALAERALRSFQRAFAINANLRRRCAPMLAEAESSAR